MASAFDIPLSELTLAGARRGDRGAPVTVLDKLRSRGDEQTVKIEVLRQNRKVTLNGKIPMADAGRHGIEKRKRVEVIVEDDDDEDEGT